MRSCLAKNVRSNLSIEAGATYCYLRVDTKDLWLVSSIKTSLKKERRHSTQHSWTGITLRASRLIALRLRFVCQFGNRRSHLGESTVNLRELAERISETRRYLDGEVSIASRQSYDALYGEDTVRLRRAVGEVTVKKGICHFFGSSPCVWKDVSSTIPSEDATCFCRRNYLTLFILWNIFFILFYLIFYFFWNIVGFVFDCFDDLVEWKSCDSGDEACSGWHDEGYAG